MNGPRAFLALAVAALAALAGCSRSASPSPLPPLALAPARPALEALIAKAPAPPTSARLAELRELVGVGYSSTAGDERLAARARASLADSKDAPWGFEAALAHEDPAVRSQAAFQLATARSHASLPPLVLRLKYETDSSARIWVAAALGQLGNGAGLDVLRDAFRVAEIADEAGRAAIDLLVAAGRKPDESPTWDGLARALAEQAREWRRSGRPIVPAEPDAAAAALLLARISRHLVATDEFQLRDVDDARFLLARLGVLPLPQLRLALGASEPYLRNHALEIAAALGEPARELSTSVLALLGDKLSEPFAIQALGAIQAPDALPHLVVRLGAEDQELRAAAAAALGDLGEPAACEPLRALMRSTGETLDVRVRAAASLGCLERGGDGLAFLLERRKNRDYHEPTVAELIERIQRR
jgi:HEAT repeat protein